MRALTVSPVWTVAEAFAAAPFTFTCPARHSAVDAARVGVARTAHSHRSTRATSTPQASHERPARSSAQSSRVLGCHRPDGQVLALYLRSIARPLQSRPVRTGLEVGHSMGTMSSTLYAATLAGGRDDVLESFLAWTAERGITLYPAQEEALLEVFAGSHVIVNTPTGSGKSLVALGAHVAALSSGMRSFYTAPIKALVSEKFFALCGELGAENVGMLTGDAIDQRLRPGHLRHRRDRRQHGAPQRRGQRHRPGRHGRVPLLRRP